MPMAWREGGIYVIDCSSHQRSAKKRAAPTTELTAMRAVNICTGSALASGASTAELASREARLEIKPTV